MRAKIQGTVLMQCVVRADGSVTDVQVVRSLDPVFGLDQEAIIAARQWKFQPGTRMGQPVAYRSRSKCSSRCGRAGQVGRVGRVGNEQKQKAR
jgi:protein TonB